MAQDEVAFSHEAEVEFARILNYYGVSWVYEPQTFALLSDGDACPTPGCPVRIPHGGHDNFTPDFYLPEFNLFVEITAATQHNARYKRVRMRHMAEQQPNVRILLLDRNGLMALLTKFGRRAIAPQILGAAGQRV